MSLNKNIRVKSLYGMSLLSDGGGWVSGGRECTESGRQNGWVLEPSLPCGSCNFSRIDLGKGTEQSIWFSLIGSRTFVEIFLVILKMMMSVTKTSLSL